MQAVSQAWKDAQRQTLVPESFIEIGFSVTDPEAAADAQASDNGHDVISNAQEIVDDVENDPVRYGFLELNMWALDGTCEVLPNAAPYGRNGFVGSQLCNENCEFPSLPTITISFSKTYTSVLPGLTITWGTAYNEWASRFRVTVYNGSTVVSQNVAENDSVTTVWARNITTFSKIVVEVLAWSLPFRRARIDKLRLGVEKTYYKRDIMSFQHTMRVNPLSAELPKSEIKFTVKNLNGEYDPYNPSGVEQYMMERQQLSVRYGYKLGNEIEWISGGVFYLNGWDMPQNGIKAGFTARDLLEYLNGKYTGAATGSLGDIARRALALAGLPLMADGSSRWVVSTVLNSIQAPSGVDLSKNTLAEVVQYAANAGCCVMYPDREGRLIVGPLAAAAAELDYPIDKKVSYANAELTMEKPLRTVNINDGQYVLTVSSVGEDEPVTNPLISSTQAPKVAQWVASFLTKRNVLSGSWRADPRLDALDRVENENQFGERVALVTEISYSYNGAFRGSYKAKEGA